jgi:rhamnosyl/mannosyltransferase
MRVLFVGQMRGYKGIEWLLPAVAGHPEIELTLVGSGPHLHDYERLAEDLGGSNVRFLGRVLDRDLHKQYDANDVIVLPSVTAAEAFGLVVLEGMSACCVPVVSDLPGVRDLVRGIGVVVPPRDSVSLRAALLGLTADPERREHLGRLARARAEELKWQTAVDRYELALGDVMRCAGREITPVSAGTRAPMNATSRPIGPRPVLRQPADAASRAYPAPDPSAAVRFKHRKPTLVNLLALTRTTGRR